MFQKLAAVLISALFFLVPAQTWASGFFTSDQGAKTTSMGAATVACIDDATAVYFNPAALTEMDGVEAAMGFTTYYITGKFKSDSGADASLDEGLAALPHFYARAKVTDRLAFGLATYSDFGLQTDWEDNWEGRFMTGATFGETQTISINPVVAWKVSPALSIAAGPVIRYMSVDLKNRVPNLLGALGILPAVAETGMEIEGDDWAYGYSLALMAHLTDRLSLGVTYKSETRHNLTGDFSIDDDGLNGYSDTSVTARITLPAYADIGLAWTQGKWTLAGAVLWTQWSSYDQLSVNFGTTQGVPGVNAVDGMTMKTRWDDTFTFKLGAEYALTPQWDLRCGVLYDPSPVPDDTLDPLVPTGDRLDFTLGFGYTRGALKVDVAYLLINDEGRRFDNAVGDFTAWGMSRITGEFDDFTTHALAVSVSYSF